MKFSIIIPTLGEVGQLNRLLNSLADLREIESAEVLLVFNPPTQKIDLALFQWDNLRVRVLFSAKGVNHARNKGLESARGQILLFLDDDCWIDRPDFLLQHFELHQRNPWATAIGGTYQNIDPSKWAVAYNEIQRDWLLNNRISPEGECLTLLGGHFSMKNDRKWPSFDETIVYGGAETEFFFRLGREGHRFLFVPLHVCHEPRIDIFSFIKKAYLQGKTHRRLLAQGLFRPAPWSSRRDQKGLQALYSAVFHLDWLRLSPKPCKKFRKAVKRLHHDLWFFLSNRNDAS